jgi:hypothetical protein
LRISFFVWSEVRELGNGWCVHGVLVFG